MKKSEKKVPELRFKGFSDDWEQRKLGMLAEIKDSARIPNALWTVSGVPYLRSSDVSEAGANGNLFISEKTYADYKRKTSAPEKGDLLFTSGGQVGITYLKTDDTPLYVQGGAILYIRTSKSLQLDGGFVKYYFASPTMKNYMDIVSTGLTLRHFTLNPANAAPVIYPTLFEQKRISAFFKRLDETIALHQRQLDLYKGLKKGYLQQLFPSQGEKQPRLRFANFTGDWEQRKLGEVSERIHGNDGRMDLPTLTISAGSGWLDQRERFSGNIAGNEQKNYTLLKKGELSYNHGNSKLAKYGAVFKLSTYEEALVPKIYHSFRTTQEAVPDFIEYMFATKRPDRELRKLVSSGARMDGLLNINYNEFMEIKIFLPSVKEQIKISELLRRLGHLIALHQNELDQLKRLKQAYLQKLFI